VFFLVFGNGANANEKLVTDPEDRKLLEEDRHYFHVADLNKDGKLTREEFDAFQNPEHYRHMHDTLVKVRQWAVCTTDANAIGCN
jgi:hypothetical protein